MHRVIVGHEYYEPFGLEPQEVVARAITHLIRKKVARQTEGAVPRLCLSCSHICSHGCQTLHSIAHAHCELGVASRCPTGCCRACAGAAPSRLCPQSSQGTGDASCEDIIGRRHAAEQSVPRQLFQRQRGGADVP